MLVLSFVLSFTFAVTWVTVMTKSLPRTDGAYGQAPFADPLVLPIMSMFAAIAALFTYPFLYSTLKESQLPKAILVLASIVIIEIVVVTPFNAAIGFVGSFVAYLIGLGSV